MIIGLGYQARSGKDTVADYLVLKHGFIKTAFAAALKEAAECIFGLNYEQLHGSKKEEIDPYWDDTPRNILQKLGTECLRNGYREDVWVMSLRRFVMERPKANWVISDCRFPNEAQAVKEMGGFAVNIIRPHRDKIATTQHASEVSMTDYDGWDYTIQNDKDSLANLYALADRMLVDLVQKEPDNEQ